MWHFQKGLQPILLRIRIIFYTDPVIKPCYDPKQHDHKYIDQFMPDISARPARVFQYLFALFQ